MVRDGVGLGSWGVGGLGRGCGWKSGKACLMLIVLVGMTALSLSGMGLSLLCIEWVGWEGGVDDGRDGMGWWVEVWGEERVFRQVALIEDRKTE